MLLDINLGDGSGFELCKELRKKTEIPILFISARTSDDDRIIALSIGGNDYVQKPYSLEFRLLDILLPYGTDVDAFNLDIKERLGNNVNMAINVEETVTAGVSVYVQLMTMIVIGVLVLSGGVIAFVLYLLVGTRLNSKKQDYGIMKSFGFTTRQLIVRTAISFMPPIILSTIVGLAAGCAVINPLMSLFLSSTGIVKCAFTVPAGIVFIEGIGIILFTFIILCLMSRKIKKLAVHSLLIGE